MLILIGCAALLKLVLSRSGGATHDEEAIARDLVASRERLLHAYSMALAEPTRLVEAVAGAAGDVAAVDAVRAAFGFDEEQALAVLQLSFQRAVREQVERIDRELAYVRDQLAAFDQPDRT